jgi:Zn-dependent protease with chaperone function
MTFLKPWLEQPLAEAVGWALVHFLWQGATVALVVAGLLALMRRQSAQTRYLTACAGLAIMSLFPIATLAWCRADSSPLTAVQEADHVVPAPEEPSLASETSLPPDAATPRERLPVGTPELEAAARHGAPAISPEPPATTVSWHARVSLIVPWLVGGWLAGVVLLSLRLLNTWAGVQRLRRAGASAPSGDVIAISLRLIARLHVTRPVQLLLSTLVEVPTVIGWLSPVILLPAGALAGLTPVQLEALLAHELAHIRRWDYLINLLQNVVETLLFYHPAVWWLSARVRQERENCCDDLAARACGDRVSYAEALVRMEELRAPAGNVALAASGGQLLYRVRRLLGTAERDVLFPLWPSGAIALAVAAGVGIGLWHITEAAASRAPRNSPADGDAPPFDRAATQLTESDAGVDNELINARELNDEEVLPQEGDKPAGELSARQVTDAIGKAKRALLTAQQRDGSWKLAPDIDQYRVGVSSLAMLALLNSGMSTADPEIQRGLDWLRRQEPTYTYEISLMIQTLAAAKDGKRDIAKVATLARDLEDSQIRQGPNAGSWSYSKGLRQLGGGDRSNGQFAVLGLREAQEMGVPVGLETWRLARQHWLSTQNDDGGWSYGGSDRYTKSTGSMTVAGIATLVMTQAMLRAHEKELDASGAPICCGEPRADKPLEDACRWLGNNFQVASNPREGRWLLYYLYGLERAGRFSGNRFFASDRGQKHDWYREGAAYLIKTQNPSVGTWEEGERDSIVGTSFVLMFLSKGLAPVLINKLQYGPLDPNRNIVTGADWNRHPHDVRNLTQYISDRPKWPKLLSWQTVEVSQATAADLLQAPILFFNGSEAPQFSPQQVALLKEFVEQGGFIFADNCCRSQPFDEGFRDLVRQMFPPAEAPLKKLQADHPVFRSEFNLLDGRTGEPTVELWGVDVGGRTSIIYSSDRLSCFWDKWTSFAVPERPEELVTMITRATYVGVNVVAYATGRKTVNKLDRPR